MQSEANMEPAPCGSTEQATAGSTGKLPAATRLATLAWMIEDTNKKYCTA
jgi:hypothetical protein